MESGSYEVGAVNFAVWEKELAAGQIDTGKVRVIWETPPYPDYNWTIRGDVDRTYGKGFVERVQKALLSMDDPDLLGSFPRSKFISADNGMYEPILETAKHVGIIEK